MGYTHYYYTQPEDYPQDKWDALIKDVKIAVKNFPNAAEDGWDNGDVSEDSSVLRLTGCFKYAKPKFSKDFICLNGGSGEKRVKNNEGYWHSPNEDRYAHETFRLNRRYIKSKFDPISNEGVFGCCKTARKPYDFAVMVILILAKYHLNITVRSDGAWNREWTPAFKFVTANFGEDYLLELMLDTEEV